MQDSTLISNLPSFQSANTNERKDPVQMISYDDVLKNMKEPEQPTNVQSQPIPQEVQQPILEKQINTSSQLDYYPGNNIQQPMYNNQISTKQQNTSDQKVVMGLSDVQNELLIILFVYVVLHTDQFQNILKSKIPSMYENDKITIFGTVFNGICFLVIWKIFEKVIKVYI